MTNLILILLIINFLADQLFQSRQILKSKNTNVVFMMLHVFMWSAPMAIFSWIVAYKTHDLGALKWWLIIIPIHFLIEWPINRYTTYLLHNKRTTLAITMIHLEKLLLNLVVVGLFIYFIG